MTKSTSFGDAEPGVLLFPDESYGRAATDAELNLHRLEGFNNHDNRLFKITPLGVLAIGRHSQVRSRWQQLGLSVRSFR